jgi:GNAT superfamily N-acetyltransferase
MQLDDILEKYPKTVELKNGSSATIRPLKTSDEKQFHAFFVAVPDNERILFKHRVTDPAIIHDWCQRIDYGKILPLLAFDGNKVVADASLHQTLGGWKRHIGRLSVVVHPGYRGRGLAGILVNELVDIARNVSLEKLEAEFLGNQMAARRVFQERGFNELLVLEDYVKDMQAISHDYVLMGRHIITDEEYTSAAG